MLINEDHALTRLTTFFEQHKIAYELHQHKPVFTVAESHEVSSHIPGAHSKNLFLKDRKQCFFLVSILEYKRLDVKAMSKIYGKGGLSFASAELLDEKLGLIPGAVTPYGLINDESLTVKFILDEDFLKQEMVNFHPLRNDYTVSVQAGDFLKFCELVKHKPDIIKIPEL